MENKNIILEVKGLDMTKAELKRLIQQLFKDEMKKKEKKKEITSEKDVKDIVRKMLVNQQKFFWEKKSFWMNNI